MGKRLKTLREARHMTQAALAKDARLSRGYLVRLEAGQQDPTLGTLERLAKALGVPVTELLA
jgi:XRE family transcriptional regulator, regulator of sulfur utilization